MTQPPKFVAYWQVTVGKANPYVIAQFADRFDVVEFMKAIRKHYSRKCQITGEYIRETSAINPPEPIIEMGTRRVL